MYSNFKNKINLLSTQIAQMSLQNHLVHPPNVLKILSIQSYYKEPCNQLLYHRVNSYSQR